MTDIVNPRLVRNMPPAPLDSDPPAVFDDKAKNLALWYPNWVTDNNNQADDNRQNAQATHERALAAHGSADAASGFAQDALEHVDEANQAVVDVRAALAAIKAGPVASVMGRTGVVTGLVEQAAVLGAGVNLDTILVSGFYQVPTGFSIGGADPYYRYDIDGGQLIVSRAGSSVFQLLAAGTTVICRNGTNNGASWSPWQRLIGDLSGVERLKYVPNTNGGVYNLSTAEAAIHYVDITTATTINFQPPRKHGDQFTLLLHFVGGAWPVGFSSNGVLPAAPFPAYTVNRMLAVTAVGVSPSWYLYPGPQHAV